MARVLDSVTLPIKKNGTKTNQNYVNNPKSTAGQFSTSTAYAVGQYVYYDKKLYRFTTAHAAGAWNASHVTEVTVTSELASLKAETNDLKQELSNSLNPLVVSASDIEQGVYNPNTGYFVPSTNRVRFKSKKAIVNSFQINFTPGTKTAQYIITLYTASGSVISGISDWTSESVLNFNLSYAPVYLMMAFRKSDNADITPSEYDATVKITYNNAYDKDARNLIYDLRTGVENPATITIPEIERGSFNSSTGAKVSSTTRLRFIGLKTVHKGSCIEFTQGANVKDYVATVFNKAGTALRIYSSWISQAVLPLEISDDTGYLMMAFRKSNDAAIDVSEFDATVTIKQYEVYSNKVDLEKGALDSSSGNRFSLNSARHGINMRNKYPVMLNGSKILIMPQMESSSVVFFADEDDAYISTVNLNTTRNTIIPVPSSAVYFDIDISNQNRNSVEFETFGGGKPYCQKRSYRYSGNTMIVDFDVEHEDNVFTCMSFDLPPNYTPNGEKVPIFLWIAGTGGYPDMYSVFQGGETRTSLEYLRDEGYAVIQIFSVGSYYYSKFPTAGKDMPYPIPIAHNCIISGLQYFSDRYNVDADNINVIGLSFGGIMGFHYVMHPIKGMRSVTLFDPCIDTLSMRGRFSDARKLLAEELDFQGTHVEDFFDIEEDGTTESGTENYYFSERCQAVWADNMPALIRINPSWSNLVGNTFANNYQLSLDDARLWWRGNKYDETDVYTHPEYKMISTIPLKIVGAMDDASTPHQIMIEKVDQLRNSGNPAEIYMVETGGHTSTSISPDTEWVEDITTALGIPYTDVRIGWIEAVKFARLNA